MDSDTLYIYIQIWQSSIFSVPFGRTQKVSLEWGHLPCTYVENCLVLSDIEISFISIHFLYLNILTCGTDSKEILRFSKDTGPSSWARSMA